MPSLADHPAEITFHPSTDSLHAQTVASIILVNYNGRTDLVRCLSSLYDHLGSDTGIQVVVVDNGSQEGDLDGLAQDFPEVEWFSSATNLGFAGGCNLGGQHARGEALVFINTDTQVSSGWLESLLAPFAADPGVGLVTSQVRLMADPERLNTAGNNIHLSGLTMCREAGQPPQAAANPAEVSAVSGAAFAIRKSLFERLGGFDVDYFMYMEETDLSWRARLAGYRCWYAPASVIYHAYSLRFRPDKTFYQERNRYQTLLKNLHWGSLLVLLPVLFLAELVTWGYVLAFQRAQWWDKPRAYAWVLRNWKAILQKRKQAQALRRVSDRQILADHTTRLDFEQVAEGRTTRLAHAVFDPAFAVLKRLTLPLIRW